MLESYIFNIIIDCNIVLYNVLFEFLIYYTFSFFLFRAHLQHMKVPRLGGELELQLMAFATVTATQDPSHICDLHCSSWQHQILNPLSGPGIKPTFSWILIGFITTERKQDLPLICCIFKKVVYVIDT